MLIPKGGKDPGLLGNRRPISLMNSMTKVLETLVKEEVQESLEVRKILPENQFGFRARLSATQQAMTHESGGSTV